MADVFFIIEYLVYCGIVGDEGVFKHSYSFIDYVCSFFLVHQGWAIERSPGINNPTWYLCVLILLYVLFYLIEFIIKRIYGGNKLRVIIYLAFVILGVLGWYMKWDAPFLHLTDFRGYAAFFLGCLLCILCKTIRNRKTILLISAGLFVSFVVVIIVRHHIEWYPCILLGIPSVLLLSVGMKQIKLPYVDIFGASSFEVYLWHTPLLYLFLIISEWVGINYNSFIVMVLILLLIEIIATLIFWFIERPISKRISLLQNRRTVKKQKTDY